MDKKQIFELAKAKRAQEKQEEQERSNGGSFENQLPDTEYVALRNGAETVFRILGNPIAVRSEPTDPKKVNMTLITGDDDKRFRCIFPDRNEDPNWILWRIIDLVLKGKYVGSGDSRHKEYEYEKEHPECFKRVRWNGRENAQYEKGWLPKTYICMNIIDRADPGWHKENKRTKLLSGKGSDYTNDDNEKRSWYDIGVSKLCYDLIWDDVVEFSGDWEDYDVVVKKLDSDPWYKAFHGVEDARKISDVSKSLVVEGPLTEEEKAYERYDLDQYFGVTTYHKIKAKLGKFIKKVDADFDKNFSEELDKLVEEESAKWKAEGKNEFGQKETVVTSSQKDEKLPQKHADSVPEDFYTLRDENVTSVRDLPQEEVPIRTAKVTRTAGIDWEGLANGTYNGKKYVGVPRMTEKEKAMVKGVREDGSFIYELGARLLKNPASEFYTPETFHIDPLNGDVF